MRHQRIVFLTRSSGYGGAEKHLLQLVTHLRSLDTDVVIYCFAQDPYTARAPAGCTVSSGLKLAGFSSFRALLRKAHARTAVFVHSDIDSFPTWAYIAARLAGYDRLYAIQHFMPPSPGPKVAIRSAWDLIRRIAGARNRWVQEVRVRDRLTRQTICVSTAVRNVFLREYGCRPEKAIAIPNGVDVKEFAPNADAGRQKRRELGIPPNVPLIVYIGRLEPDKSVDLLLHACAILQSTHPSFVCIILGEGGLESSLRSLTEKLNLGSKVMFAGFQSDVRPYLCAADVFVLCSPQEALPFALLEALACGTACVSTDSGGPAEMIENGTEGLIVPIGSAELLKGAIAYLLENPEARKKMGAAARTKAVSSFNVSRQIEQLGEVLLEG